MLTIEGASDDAQPFKRVKNNITSRLRTFNEVSWAVSSRLTEKAAGPDQRSPDLSAVMQEIGDRAVKAARGWCALSRAVATARPRRRTVTGRRRRSYKWRRWSR